MKGNDYILWNRAGAICASFGKERDALIYYERALAIKPKYARALQNMAISFHSLKYYPKAIQYALRFLRVSKKHTSPTKMATHIITLCVTSMDKHIEISEDDSYEDILRKLNALDETDYTSSFFIEN
jgi:tetratricopeptide (TPR) repeat protein